MLDTTVWCSAFLSRNKDSASRRIWDAWRNGVFVAVVSGPVVDELARVLVDELEIPEADVDVFVALLCAVSDVVPVEHQVMGCRDPYDDPFLETAVLGKAEYLVSHDGDLLELPDHVREYLTSRGVEVLPDSRTGARDFCTVLRELDAASRK